MKWIQNLHLFIQSIFENCFKFYKVPWVLFSLTIVFSITMLPKTRLLVMMSDLLDKDFETYEQFHKLNNDFVEENQVSLIIKSGKLSSEAMTLEQHCRVVKWLNWVHLNHDFVKNIFSSYGLKEGRYTNNRLRVSPILVPDCTKQYTKKELRFQLEKIGNSPSGHILTDRGKRDIFASFYIHNLGAEKANYFGQFDVSAFEELKESFESQVLKFDKNLEVVWNGIGTYQYYLQKSYEQMGVVNLVTGIILVLGLRIFMGSFASGALVLSVYFFMTIILYGVMAFFSFPIDSLSSAAPIMLLISTIEDFIFFFVVYRKRENAQESFKSILLPSFYTSLTTGLGFASLYFSELSIIRRFGLICAFGALLEWVVLFLVLPKIICYLENRFKNFPVVLYRKPLRLRKIEIKKPLRLFCMLPIVLLLFSLGKEIRINDSPEQVFPQNHPIQKATDYLLDSRGWKSEVSLVFPSSRDWKFQLYILERIKKVAPAIVNHQSAKQAKDYLLKDVDSKAAKSFIDMNFEDSWYAKRWISDESEAERILLYSNTTDVVEINSIRNLVKKICLNDCYIANILVSYSEFGIKVLRTLTKSFSVTFLIIVALIIVLCRFFQIKKTLLIIFSSLWGPLSLIAVFLFFDIGIYFATSVVMSVLVGLAGDNAIQFIFASRVSRSNENENNNIETGIEEMQEASDLSLILMLLTSVGFLVSDFEGVRKIGLMMILGVALGWIGDVLVLKSFLRKRS